MPEAQVRNAAAEADSVVGPSHRGVVLEPSPPAVADGEWFADDPVAAVGASGRTRVVPAGMATGGDIDWDRWLTSHPGHEAWVRERWLGGARRLPDAPPGLAATRVGLHRLAAYVIAPSRHRVTGKFGLRWTLGGFGTPFFGADRQIRVVGDQLVDQRGSEVRAGPIGSLAAAASFLESAIDTETAAEHDSPDVGDVDEPLAVDPAAAGFLGDWFGMAFAALERARAEASSVAPSRPQIWPGHFDAAIEIGDDDHRASYGASPGDDMIDEPYLYVSVWWPDRIDVDRSDPRWNAESFTGSILRSSDFGAGDPVDIAARFWTDSRNAL